jgi:hypothetical protein
VRDIRRRPFRLRISAHIEAMTKLLEKAGARELPPDMQDEIARVILVLAQEEDAAPIALTPEEEASLTESLAQASRGEFVTDEQVRAVWAKSGCEAPLYPPGSCRPCFHSRLP